MVDVDFVFEAFDLGVPVQIALTDLFEWTRRFARRILQVGEGVVRIPRKRTQLTTFGLKFGCIHVKLGLCIDQLDVRLVVLHHIGTSRLHFFAVDVVHLYGTVKSLTVEFVQTGEVYDVDTQQFGIEQKLLAECGLLIVVERTLHAGYFVSRSVGRREIECLGHGQFRIVCFLGSTPQVLHLDGRIRKILSRFRFGFQGGGQFPLGLHLRAGTLDLSQDLVDRALCVSCRRDRCGAQECDCYLFHALLLFRLIII